jgi:hypothetical protein
VDKKEKRMLFLKSIEQQHLFYESAYNESAYKKCPRQRKKGVKALTFYRACKRLQEL